MSACEECGFDYGALATDQVAAALGAVGARYRSELASVSEATARRRPAPSVWSALEYTCHVRDVLLVQRDRALVALVEERPSFPRMHREERVRLARYDAQPMGDVVDQLCVAATLAAWVFEGLSADQWGRGLVYNWPAPADHDVAWLARHTLHECEHHLGDVRSVLAQLSTR